MGDYWSMLPKDILGIIALKLDSIEDLVYFSAVCHSWNHAFNMVKLEWSRVDKPTTPWLLLGEPTNKNNDDGCRKILSIEKNNKCYELSLPETFGARCWGSPYGFILMLHLNKKIELFNPITKARLNLPSLQTLPIDPEDWQKLCVRKFIILKMPQSDEFLVMAIHWRHDNLAFARLGDQTWTPIHTSCARYYQVIDVCFWDRLLLILYQDGTLAYCDIMKSDFTAKLYLPVPCDVFRYVLAGNGEMYMVVIDGHLHVVSRMKEDFLDDDGYSDYRTYDFFVYKLDVENKLWEKVECLMDVSFFVGNNTSMFANTSNAQRNAIYFTDDEKDFWRHGRVRFRGHDMGVLPR
ncbi:uncharacterized protein LOC110705827 [Chenopodium quinoa]|nr:uncharacterized protein LOC110705827 [Chenopodium quinoa]